MEYVYAALLLHETDEEINEDNLTGVLEAAGVDVEESRVKALVAALEDVDVEEAIETAAAVPAAGASGASATEETADASEEADEADDGDDEAEAEAEEEDDDDEDGGEGLGELFG